MGVGDGLGVERAGGGDVAIHPFPFGGDQFVFVAEIHGGHIGPDGQLFQGGVYPFFALLLGGGGGGGVEGQVVERIQHDDDGRHVGGGDAFLYRLNFGKNELGGLVLAKEGEQAGFLHQIGAEGGLVAGGAVSGFTGCFIEMVAV